MCSDIESFCGHCNACLNDQPGYDENCAAWICSKCGHLTQLPGEVYVLYGSDTDMESVRFPGVIWYCDGCNAFLNEQVGFDDNCNTWACTACGHVNGISEDDIYASKEDYLFRDIPLPSEWSHPINEDDDV